MTIGTGTTARLAFTFVDAEGGGVGSAAVEAFFVTLAQNGVVKVEKTLTECTFDDAAKTVTVALTQADTLALLPGTTVELQWRARLTDGSAIKSNIVLADADRVLKPEVI